MSIFVKRAVAIVEKLSFIFFWRKKKYLKCKDNLFLFFSIFLFMLITSIALYRFEELKASLCSANIYYVLSGIIFYYANYFFRSKRIVSLSHNTIPFMPQAVNISSIHGILSYLFPLRIGDLTLPVILKKVASIQLLEGGEMLIKARLLDISILGFFTFCSAIIYSDTNLLFRFLWMAMGGSMMFIFSILNYLIKILPVAFSCRLPEAFRNLCRIDIISFQDIINTFLIWVFIGLSLFSVTKAVGLNLSFQEIWILVTIQLPLQLSPIQGVANAGNHELGWVTALVFLGVDSDAAFQYALTSHAIFMIYVLALIVPALISSRYLIEKRNKTNV